MLQNKNKKLLAGIFLVFIAGVLCGFKIYQKLDVNPTPNGTVCKLPQICVFPPAPKNVNLYQTLPENTGHTLPGNPIYSVAIRPQSPMLVSGSNNSKITLWDVETGQTVGTLEQTRDSFVESLAISHDGLTLASGGSHTGTIYIWDLPNQRLFKTLPPPPQAFNVTSLALNSETGTLASGHSNGEIKIWDVATENLKYDLGHGQRVNFLAISSDGQILASGSENGEIKIWDPYSGLLKYNLNHTSGVKSLAISPDGQILVSGSENGEIKIWNLDTGLLEYDLNHSGRVTSLAINSDGTLLASGSSDGTIKLWFLSRGWYMMSKGKPLETYSLSEYSQNDNTLTLTLTFGQDKNIYISGHSSTGPINIWFVPYSKP